MKRGEMRPNRLRAMLNAGEPTFGTHVLTPWPGVVEVIARSGAFDYIEYVGEYSPFDADSLDHLGRAFDLFPDVSSMMKVEEQNRGFIATRSIDSGIQNVLFTDCRNVAEVEECVRIVRPETPELGGTHGVGMRRSVGYVYGGGQTWVDAMKDVVIAIMIEKKPAMDNLDSILEVEGVDMVQFGPADYSITVGKPGATQDPEVQDAQKLMVEKALAAGVHPRVEVGSFEQAKPWVDRGVRHFCIGWDLVTLASWCAEQQKGIETLLD